MSLMTIHFANDAKEFRFSILQYLAEKFPPVARQPAFGLQLQFDMNAAAFANLASSDREQLNDLRNVPSPDFGMSETATVFDALAKLDEWLISTLRARLPQPVIQALTGWLESQWRLYCVAVPVGYSWTDYFWQYLRLLGENDLAIHGKSLGIIPPLVGRVDVHPVGLKSLYHEEEDEEEEDEEVEVHPVGLISLGIQPQWRHESIEKQPTGGDEGSFTPASLCDTLGYSFSERHPVCGPDGDVVIIEQGDPVERWEDLRKRGVKPRLTKFKQRWKRMDERWQWPCYQGEQAVRGPDGRIQMEEHDGYSLYLLVNYHGTSLGGSWLERMAGFPHFPAALQPRDHWVMRMFEVHNTMSKNTVSRVLPSCIVQRLQQFPRVKWEVEQCARAVAVCRHRLRDPVWLDPATLKQTADAALQQRKEKAGNRRYDSQTATFFGELRSRTPLASNLSSNLGHLMKEGSPGPTGQVGLPFDSWQEGMLLAAELTAMPQHLVFARQQELLDMHRQVCGALENLLREVFKITRHTPKKPKHIDPAFCEWVASKHQRYTQDKTTHVWDKPLFDQVLQPALGGSQRANNLAQRIDNTMAQAKSKANQLNINNLGTLLDKALQLPWCDVGTAAWHDVLCAFGRATEEGFANTLLAGKLLILV